MTRVMKSVSRLVLVPKLLSSYDSLSRSEGVRYQPACAQAAVRTPGTIMAREYHHEASHDGFMPDTDAREPARRRGWFSYEAFLLAVQRQLGPALNPELLVDVMQ